MGNANGKDPNGENKESIEYLKKMQKQIMENQIDIQRMQLDNLHKIQGIPNTYKDGDYSENIQNKRRIDKIKNDNVEKRIFLLNLLNNNKQMLNNEQILKIKSLIFKLNSQLGYDVESGINPVGDEIGQSNLNYGTRQQQVQQQGQQQVKHNEIYKYDYNTQEELEKKDYERKQAKLKEEYIESQRRRKIEFQKKMEELKYKKNDAFKLFGLNKNYNSADLKRSYKRLAIRTHPDKYNGDDTKFKIVTEYYFLLKEHLNEMKEHKPHNEFRDEYNKPKPVDVNVSHAKMGTGTNGKDFNIKLFNKVFEENRIYDDTQEGYEDWLKGDSDIKQPKLFSKKFNLDVFNETFEQHKVENPNNQIIKYEEPQALVSSDLLGYGTNIDGSKNGGFTKYTGGGGVSELGYCDLKEAYTNGNLISSLNATRDEYKDITDLERERASVRFTMTPEETAAAERKKKEEEDREQLRLERIKERDYISEKHYGNVHERLLGYRTKQI